MAGTIQKNITLPPELARAWESFQPLGSKESSANSAGALFLYMLMPADVREIARQAAYKGDFKSSRDFFWKKLAETSDDAALAKTLLADVEARQIRHGKKKRG